ncbi:DUF1572 domain-containing protein [Flavobacteriales bacterium 34_180_T64]|nr:DUF1572 domain-containing protein [Flavobacteriales bacterium 34_180_T64]
MENSNQLANRFKDVLLDGKWIANTNFKDLLSNTTYEQATTKVGALNTIAALAFHINYYIAGILNVFEGGNLDIRDKYSFDHPSYNSKEKWESLLDSMWSNAEQFANHVELMSDDTLETYFVNEKYGSYRRNIEGVIEHSYYHLGQISLIQKLIRESKNI